MRKVDDGEEKKRKEEEKNDVFSGHYVIASSLPPERRPLERRTLVPIDHFLITSHNTMQTTSSHSP